MSVATEVDRDVVQRAPGAARGAAGSPVAAAVDYPDSDGEPIADNTLEYEWIALLKENLDATLPDFVAGAHLWYPVEGRPEIRMGPDVMVCLGRPKGHRGSYMQFREDGVPPAVVFEVLSPRNTAREMVRKGLFHFRHGVREFIVVDPEHDSGWAMVRVEGGEIEEVPTLAGWTSPTLGIRFAVGEAGLQVFRPDGTRFRGYAELEAEQRAAVAEAGRARTEAAEQAERARTAEARAARLAEKLAALGLSADDA
jgi:Uma2 family endonuclease